MTGLPGCYYCRKHITGEDAPPGGWLIEDDHWYVGHGLRATAFLHAGMECGRADAQAAAARIRAELALAEASAYGGGG